jgi:hypothetical protein
MISIEKTNEEKMAGPLPAIFFCTEILTPEMIANVEKARRMLYS